VLARALVCRGIPGSFACLHDAHAAAAAHAAGLGGRLDLAIGGHSPTWRGVADAEPLASSWTVTAAGEVRPSFVRVDTPGVTTADASRLPERRRRRPLFPYER
jgi:microcystin degradation protein MlrC